MKNYSKIIRNYRNLAEQADSFEAEEYLKSENLSYRQKQIIWLNYDRQALIDNDVFDLEAEFNKIESEVI